MRRCRLRWVIVAGWLLSERAASAAVSDAAFTDALFVNNVGVTTSLAWAPDGSQRLFLASKSGEVRVIEKGKLLATPFVTVSPIVTAVECGLLGLAFDPDFVQNGYVYLFATVSQSEQQILRYTAQGNVGVDRKVIVSGLPTRGANHDGGALAFGPDGKLYWAVGDNGAFLGVGADLRLLNAKVGRANRDGSVPSDNPFVDGAGPNNDYIWASGYRNPFKMTFQPGTGALWLNVVGTRWEQIFTVAKGDNGGYSTYESNQPESYASPVISYATNTIESHSIPSSGTVRLGGVATVYTTEPHRFRPGAKITIADVTDPSFNGSFFLSEVLSPTQFSFKQAGPDALSGNGTASAQDIGGCVTGGTFWDSTAVPAAYRGNFFFGDFNSGKIVRATLDAANHIASVDEWGSGIKGIVDMAIGPDGGLYYAPTTGVVNRISYTPTAQGLVITPRNLRMAEGGKAVIDVRLAIAPSVAQTVFVTKVGDADVAINAEAATLKFAPNDWSVPKQIVVSAAADADSADDEARVHLKSAGLAEEDVNVRVTDAEESSFVLSTAAVSLREGEHREFTVALTQAPAAPVTVYVTRDSGDEDISVESGAELSWSTIDWSTPRTVTIRADIDADATDDSAGLLVSADGIASREVAVSVADRDGSAPAIVSEPPLLAYVGSVYAYDVEAEGLPAPSFSLEQAPRGMTINAENGLIVWVPAESGTASVKIHVANGVSPDAAQEFEIGVTDGPMGDGSGAPSGGMSPSDSGQAGAGGAALSEGGSAHGSPDSGQAGEGSSGPGGTTQGDDSSCGCRAAGGDRTRRGVELLSTLSGVAIWHLRRRRWMPYRNSKSGNA